MLKHTRRRVVSTRPFPLEPKDATCKKYYGIENRRALAPGQGFPNWQDVMRRRVDPWPEAEISLDTSVLSVGQAVREILDHMTTSGVTPLPQ